MKSFLAFFCITSLNLVCLADTSHYSVGCRVLGFNSADGFMKFKKNSAFETGRTVINGETKKVTIPLKTKSGEVRLLEVAIQKNILNPNEFEPFLHVGATYSFNNPFEPGSKFSRSDLTGATRLIGKGFSHENATGLLVDSVAEMGPANRATMNPYIQIGLFDPKIINHPELSPLREKLIAPSGDVLDSVLVVCTTASPTAN